MRCKSSCICFCAINSACNCSALAEEGERAWCVGGRRPPPALVGVCGLGERFGLGDDKLEPEPEPLRSSRRRGLGAEPFVEGAAEALSTAAAEAAAGAADAGTAAAGQREAEQREHEDQRNDHSASTLGLLVILGAFLSFPLLSCTSPLCSARQIRRPLPRCSALLCCCDHRSGRRAIMLWMLNAEGIADHPMQTSRARESGARTGRASRAIP